MTVPKANTEALLNAAHIGHAVAALLDASSDSMADAAISARTLAKHLANQAMLLSTPSISLTEVVMCAGDTAHIHGNGDVVLTRSDTRPVGVLCKCNQSPCACIVTSFTMPPLKPTLQSYFEDNLAKGIIDFSLRACRLPGGEVGFYLHPQLRSGETAQFTVNGNVLSTSVAA